MAAMLAASPTQNKIVMARFMRAIHDFAAPAGKQGVDGPDKPGHDVVGWQYEATWSLGIPNDE